jgi:hypothetical protein
MTRFLQAWGAWVVVLVALIFAYGLATNDGRIGMLLGMAAGRAIDPLIICLGLIIGIVARKWWLALLLIVVIGSGMQFAMDQLHSSENLSVELPHMGALVLVSYWLSLAVIGAIVSLVALAARGHEAASIEESANERLQARSSRCRIGT